MGQPQSCICLYLGRPRIPLRELVDPLMKSRKQLIRSIISNWCIDLQCNGCVTAVIA